MTPRLVLLTREGCSLCDAARPRVAEVAASTGTAWVERDVTADPADARAYLDLVPVVLLDGEVAEYWRVDTERLRAAVTAVSPTEPAPG